MLNSIDIGPTPSEETCQAVGTPDYDPILAKQECLQFIQAIRRVLGDEPDGARLVIISNPHDHGDYYSVACKFDEEYPESVAYAFKCEAESPRTWSEAGMVAPTRGRRMTK